MTLGQCFWKGARGLGAALAEPVAPTAELVAPTAEPVAPTKGQSHGTDESVTSQREGELSKIPGGVPVAGGRYGGARGTHDFRYGVTKRRLGDEQFRGGTAPTQTTDAVG